MLLQIQRVEKEADEELKAKEDELMKKSKEIDKLNNLLKQMATRKSRAPTMVRAPSGKPSVIGAGGRFSTLNFSIPKNFDFLGFT